MPMSFRLLLALFPVLVPGTVAAAETLLPSIQRIVDEGALACGGHPPLRAEEGLRLKHDHRLEGGSDDPVTWYGGDTATPGTALSQSFPADAETAALIPAAATNEWTMTLEPGERFIYHLTRDGEPRATFEFDLTREVASPPAPWGYEAG